MKKYFFFILCCVFTFFNLSAQNEERQLSGQIIWNDKCNDQEFPVNNAFDNNPDTYFRSCPPFGNWIGLDLGEKHIITKVVYSPRMDSDYRDRIQLGIFEGANQSDFGDAIPLFIIPGPAERKLNEQKIVCTRGFRYVRFVFPYAQTDGKSSYISELKFFGYIGNGNDTQLPQLTNLPTVSIHTVNNQDITSKEIYVKGIISVIYANGTKIHTDSLDIRGRGNNSWSYPKKPYRIKLKNSTQLMDLPAKARNWTLINNYGDKTLMRNILAFDFARRIEMPYTSPAEAVDVVLNGDYRGCYQLCDHIDVRKNRVDIEEMSSTDLTGGYLIEIDAYAYPDEPKKFTSSYYGIPVTIKYPKDDEIVYAQEKYIENHFNKFVTSVSASNYKDLQNGFRKYLDIESFLRHFLVGEYSGNTDTYWSVHMYKKRNSDQFFISPVWDFDLGFENDWRTYPINQKAWISNQWICLSDGSSAAGGTRDLVKKILSDENAYERLREIYSYYRDKGLISEKVLINEVDSCADLLNISQQLNFSRWQIMNTKVHENPVIYGSYEKEVDNVRNYVRERIKWIDSKLSYSPSSISNPDIKPLIKIQAVNGILYLEELPQNYTLQIIDTYGRTLVNQSVSSTSFSCKLVPGIYFIVLTDSQHQKSVYKYRV